MFPTILISVFKCIMYHVPESFRSGGVLLLAVWVVCQILCEACIVLTR